MKHLQLTVGANMSPMLFVNNLSPSYVMCYVTTQIFSFQGILEQPPKIMSTISVGDLI